MLRLAILSIILAFVKAQADPYEACVGLEDTTLVGFGHDVSCTKYYYCEGEIGYEEDCADLYGAEFEFSEETGACDYSDVVNCAAYGPVDPEPIVTDPPVVTQPPPPPVTQPPPPPVTDTPIVVDPNIPDITCPTNRPGEIIFFESSNCTEYFICANGIRMQMFCLEGFAWNQIDKQCDYPIFSRCAQSIADDGLNVRCTRTGLYTTAYPRDCTKFVFCAAGIPMTQNCPVGHAWHIDRCISRQYASCPDANRRLI